MYERQIELDYSEYLKITDGDKVAAALLTLTEAVAIAGAHATTGAPPVQENPIESGIKAVSGIASLFMKR